MRSLSSLTILLVVLALPSLGLGQYEFDAPERVEVADLLRTPGLYNEKVVIVVGDLRNSDYVDTQAGIYALRGESGLQTVRIGESSYSMRNLQYLQGKKVEIRGVFWDLGSGGAQYDRRLREYPGAIRQDDNVGQHRFFIGAQEIVPIDKPEPEPEEVEPAKEVADPDLPPSNVIDLRVLVKDPEPYLDEHVTVIGKFRGDNVYDDLPLRTKKTPRDFIIKVADIAIWVTGKRPRGKGFELNPDRRRDTGKWLKITGIPWMDDGVVYLKARKIEMVPKPDDPDLDPKKVDREVAEEKEEPEPPPVVVFSMPLDGERRVPLDTDFRVQFSNDMLEQSFDRNVDLLYADDDETANPFPDMQISYDPISRSLAVIPGKRLEPSREIRLILYDSIQDAEGQRLVADPEAQSFSPGAAVVMTFFTADR
jgi:hypothetical protein